MNPSIRNFLFFCLGFAAIALPMLAFAETIAASGPTTVPASKLYGMSYGTCGGACSFSAVDTTYPSLIAAATAAYNKLVLSYGAVKQGGPYSGQSCSGVDFTDSGSFYLQTSDGCKWSGATFRVVSSCASGSLSGGNCTGVYSCPTGGNWTLSGQTCTRPDCPAGQVYNANGVCSPVCVGAQFLDPDTNTCKCVYKAPATNSYQVSYANAKANKLDPPTCNNGCVTYTTGYVRFCPGAILTAIAGGSTTCYAETFQSGDICNGSGSGSDPLTVTLTPATAPAAPAGTNQSGAADPLSTTPNNSDPLACAQSGGNYGVFNGKGTCYSPSKSDPVITQKQESTQIANPQTGTNSTTTTTTTQTCTGVGSCTTSNTTTVTNNGTPGKVITTTGQGGSGSANITADGSGNFKLDLPKDYQKDATGLILNDMVKELSDVIGKPVADDSSITQAGASDAAKKALDDSDKADTAAVNGGFDSQIKSSQNTWEQAMRTWWQPIAITGCHPFSATIAGRPWVLDHCPKAAEISAIGAYVAWIGLLFAGFRLLTTPRSKA